MRARPVRAGAVRGARHAHPTPPGPARTVHHAANEGAFGRRPDVLEGATPSSMPLKDCYLFGPGMKACGLILTLDGSLFQASQIASNMNSLPSARRSSPA